MQLSQALIKLESAVDNQLRIAGPDIAEAGTRLMAALTPAITQTMTEVVSMAVDEISTQLVGQSIDIKLVDGDPELVVRDDPAADSASPTQPGADDEEARITVRLPGYLKDLIANEAESLGDSLNSYVVEALSTKTRRRGPTATRRRTTIEL
ncbi:MAG: hypothetical protein WCE80_13585 [Acidimicrobiia bacterium]